MTPYRDDKMWEFVYRIVSLLQGEGESQLTSIGEQEIPSNRLEWGGLGAVLELYRTSSGQDREDVIAAFGALIESNKFSEKVVAQVVHLITSLGLTQLQSRIDKLRDLPMASQEPVLSALNNYYAYTHVG